MTDHYLQLDPQGQPIHVWEISEHEAFPIEVHGGRGGPAHFVAEDGEHVMDTIRRLAGGWFQPGLECPFHRLDLPAGAYYPRMARPSDGDPGASPGYYPGEDEAKDTIAKGRTQLTVLVRLLERICQTVHPEGANFASYGHDIRNLLILAATEAEAHWRGILQANGVSKKHFNTKHYAELGPAMRLPEFAISMSSYPWLAPVRPFARWTAKDQGQGPLGWYQAYNKTKHDRDGDFAEATLGNAIEAVCACVVMMVAQFGLERALGDGSLLIATFVLDDVPRWHPNQVYTGPYGGAGLTPVQYPFSWS